MALFNKLLVLLSLLYCLLPFGRSSPIGTFHIKPYKRALQNIVTWDEHSLFIRGERIFFLSGEFHPFRLPVPDLWLDIFQKIKSLGFGGVSFYIDWNLVEGKQGEFTAEGIFALEPFFEAAEQAGIYLIARPGPYINAEVSGGGFPGWLEAINGTLRTRASDFMAATENYVSNVGKINAKAQITNGGPVILLQPENEYTVGTVSPFPDTAYMQQVEDQYRDAGIVVPLINNDASAKGYFAPGTGEGAVDIYSHDSYPLGFKCASGLWPSGSLPTTFRTLHLEQSPSTPYSVSEFQGGSYDPWGGSGFAKCLALVNEQFERVFYKNMYSFGITIFSLYMIYGGTNWGNIGHPGGYTSYDYAAAISEDRLVSREKYSELKLQANMLKVSPDYLTATPGTRSTSYTDNTNIIVTPIIGNGSDTNFYVVRHTTYNSVASTDYKITLNTTAGTVTIPQLTGTLTLNGRDSKIHVTDYDVGNYTLLYSSAEIFTWKKYDSKTVLVLYGGSDETHEVAFTSESQSPSIKFLEGGNLTHATTNASLVVNWSPSSSRTVALVGEDLYVYFLNRNEAYNYWVLDQRQESPYLSYIRPSDKLDSVIIKGGYLMRNITVSGSEVSLVGDLNATTTLELIGGAPRNLTTFKFNGKATTFTQDKYGVVKATATFVEPTLDLPDLSSLEWKYVDSLPELKSTYDDSAWTSTNKTTTNNPRTLTTSKNLYAHDYGYYTGNLLYRGHFTATGNESTLKIKTEGGEAYGVSIWLNSTFLGSWTGNANSVSYTKTVSLTESSSLQRGKAYVLTVLLDNMGFEEDWTVGSESSKAPRGILDYTLADHSQSDVTWKLTGNLGGEDYIDKTRGPLNEGGLYAERQGYHLPSPPSSSWQTASPFDGIDEPGVGFYATSFTLDMPSGYDVPLSFVYTNVTTTSNSSSSVVSPFRSQLYINGYQFGKYLNGIGPQTSFPVPEGILDYHGTNYLAVSLWALDDTGAKLSGLALQETAVISSGFGSIGLSPAPAWTERQDAY